MDVTSDLTLTDWLTSTSELRSALLAYSKKPISSDPGERQLDVSEALEKGQDAGDLLADSEVYLSQAFAQAVLEARQDHDAKTAQIVAIGKTADIRRLRDGLEVIYRTIKDRRFTLMSVGRW